MSRARHAALLASLLLALPACGGGDRPTGNVEEPRMSAEARAYLDRVLDIMQQHSIHRKRIDWPSFRARAVADARGAQTPAKTYPAIGKAVMALGDNHSSFMPAPGTAPNAALAAAAAPPEGEVLDGRLAYVYVPPFGEPDDDGHAAEYHRLLRRLDAEGPCGWIVDLRGNVGGSIWPMLAGIGPVLGEGIPGSFLDPDSVVNRWFYENGAAGFWETPTYRKTLTAVRDSVYRLRSPAPPVALLTGPRTASAGEAVVVAFRGRPDARSFGLPTYGVPTANVTHWLSDGARLRLTVSWYVDRLGARYDAPIAPDERVDGATPVRPPSADPVVAAASRWLRAHPRCR